MAINDPLRPLYRPATWRHCDAAMEQSGSRSWRARLSTRKTGKAIVLPLAVSLRKQIEFLLTSSNEPSAPIHPKAFDLVERQRKTGNLSNQFAELLAAAGLRQKKNHKSTGKGRGTRRNVEPLSFHSLRRTATTLLREAGVPSAVAQALIGHDSEAMHELYVSVGREARGEGDGCFAGDLKARLRGSRDVQRANEESHRQPFRFLPWKCPFSFGGRTPSTDDFLGAKTFSRRAPTRSLLPLRLSEPRFA